MPPNYAAGEKRFVWDDINDDLVLLGDPKQEDEQTKGRKRQTATDKKSKVYCPHAYLVLSFHETLNPGEKLRFRKYYMRKVGPSEANVVLLQDVKDLVMYLVTSPFTIQFINFFHLSVVDRFLRALVIYFQYYTDIWEDLARKRAATAKMAPNPLAGGARIRYGCELHLLRCMVGREYAELMMGGEECAPYHHMTSGKDSNVTATQSQGEKDLRIFEVLLRLAHRVVWVALQRKHFNLIELEIDRLFRTEAYSTAQRRSGSVLEGVLDEDLRVMYGPEIPPRRKLLKNTPLIYQLIYSDCDYRVMSLGIANIKSTDPRIMYLRNALFAEEEDLRKLGIKIGILGQPRSEYDVMLMPNEGEETSKESQNDAEKETSKMENKLSNLMENNRTVSQDVTEITNMPPFGNDPELIEVFPVEIFELRTPGDKARSEARKKWILREVKRASNKYGETSSIVTGLDSI